MAIPGATPEELDAYVAQGVARALYVHAFQMWAIEIDLDFPEGRSWDEVAPDTVMTRAAGIQAARELEEGIAKKNPGLGRYPYAAMFAKAGTLVEELPGSAYLDARAQLFGGELAAACIGTQEPGELAQFVLPILHVHLDGDGREMLWEDRGWTTPDSMVNPAKNPAWDHSSVQSLLFDKGRYSTRQAQRWAQDHGFKYGAVDDTHGEYIHLRQFEHRPGQPCATVDFGHGIEARVCATRNPSGETLWAVLVNGQRQWVAGGASQEALETARAQYGAGARLELGPNGDPVRTGDCLEAPRKRTRAPAAKATRAAAPVLQVTAIPMSIGEFAQAVQGTLGSIHEKSGPSGLPGGRWGMDKVFVAAIWRRLQNDPRFQGMTIQQFKRRLVEANRDQLLDLARADSRGDMDESEVIGSEIDDRGATFHFVVDRAARRAPTRAGMSIGEFAQAVNEALPTIQTGRGPDGRPVGRFGRQKVFVAAIWRRLQNDPRFADMARQAAADRMPVPLEFKRRLIEANRNRLLVLERADLVGAMDPTEVADSEIADRGATFHFVHDSKADPGY